MNAITYYLISILFFFPIFMLLARILLQGFRAPFSDPLYQWLLTTLNPILQPLERYIPRFRSWSLAAILLLYLVCVLKAALLLGSRAGGAGPIFTYGLVELLKSVVNLFYFLLIIRIVLSFVQPQPGNPLLPLIYRLTEPLLNPLRRLLPATGPIDFSPMVVFLLLIVLQVAVIEPLERSVVLQIVGNAAAAAGATGVESVPPN